MFHFGFWGFGSLTPTHTLRQAVPSLTVRKLIRKALSNHERLRQYVLYEYLYRSDGDFGNTFEARVSEVEVKV